jgi:PadR family transcriptional regulator PadR
MSRHDEESLLRWEAQMKKGCLELAVLAALWDQARYGLEILSFLEGEDLEVSEGTLYPLLNRLHRDGLVITDWVEGDLGHPRRYYELTSVGRDLARSMSSRWRAFTDSLRSLLTPLTKEKTDV